MTFKGIILVVIFFMLLAIINIAPQFSFEDGIYFYALGIGGLLLFFKFLKKSKKISENLQKGLKNKNVFVVSSFESTDSKHIQLYGESMKSPLCSGMRILSPWGKYYEILEVYADDNTPDKPDDIVQPGIPDTPVVISNEEWDDKEFSRVLSNQGVVVFELSSK